VRRGAFIAAAIATALLGQAATFAGHVTTRPSLRLMDSSSVAFRGSGFKPRERVQVVLVASTRSAKSVTASATGAFVVRFAGVDASSCVGFSATARGSGGSRATFKRAPGQCPSP
jgi:hypothetical protein